MQWLISVHVYLHSQLFFVSRKYVLVGTLIMHDSYFTKLTRGDKFYLDKTLFAVTALFCFKIIAGQWLEPWVAPEKRHLYISTTWRSDYFCVYFCLSIISYMRLYDCCRSCLFCILNISFWSSALSSLLSFVIASLASAAASPRY